MAPEIVEEVGSLDSNFTKVNSIMCFFMLSTIIRKSNLQNKDPILNFTTSKSLTSLEYEVVVQRLKEAKENEEKTKKASIH